MSIPNVNDIVRLRKPPMPDRPKTKPGFMVWRVVGIYLGATGAEGLIGLERLDRDPGRTNGRVVSETLMPLPLFMALKRGDKFE